MECRVFDEGEDVGGCVMRGDGDDTHGADGDGYGCDDEAEKTGLMLPLLRFSLTTALASARPRSSRLA